MSINRESDTGANLQVGPTSLGMVRVYVEAEGVDLPLDFEPEEAEEIAEELMAAAARAREMGQGPTKPGGAKPGGAKPGGAKPGGAKSGAPKPGGPKPGGPKPGRGPDATRPRGGNGPGGRRPR